MNNSLQIFNNGQFSVRSVCDNGEIWFVARDIATALEYKESSVDSINKLMAIVPEIWTARKRFLVSSENGVEQTREMLCLTEQGVYFFLGRSDKPKAQPYQIWIAQDVVPSIRKTGSYSVFSGNTALPVGVLEGAKFIFETAGITDNQLTLALDKVYKSYTGRSALLTGGIQLKAPVKEQALTPTEIAPLVGFGSGKKGAKSVNKMLEIFEFQHRVAGNWEPLEKGKPYAVMLDAGKSRSDGTPIRQLKWNSGIVKVLKDLMPF